MTREKAIAEVKKALARQYELNAPSSDFFEYRAGSLIAALETLGVLKFDPPPAPVENFGLAEIDQSLLDMIATDLKSHHPTVALRQDLLRAGLAIVKVDRCAC